MKKSLLTLVFVACAFGTYAADLFLSGTVPGVTSGKIYLQKFDNKLFTFIDSAEIKNGAFKFSTKTELPELYVLSLDPDKSSYLIFLDKEPVTVKFSDQWRKAEYTLIDFWAAWCGPCRRENPNIVATYNKYKDKGFSVFGVSLDKRKSDWLKAIETDHLTWTHVSDLIYWNSAPAKLYGVRAIPSNFLVDKNGIIVAKNIRGEELGKTLEKFLAGN